MLTELPEPWTTYGDAVAMRCQPMSLIVTVVVFRPTDAPLGSLSQTIIDTISPGLLTLTHTLPVKALPAVVLAITGGFDVTPTDFAVVAELETSSACVPSYAAAVVTAVTELAV